MADDPEARSIAAEVALLCLAHLEPRVPDNPELLVSNEAILSFATIRRSDPSRWEYWRSILTKYQKAELIEFMLSEPPKNDSSGWESNAARLVGLALHSGVEFFHDPEQHGWASVHTDQHWENYPLRSRAFYLFLLRHFYRDTGESPGPRAMRAALEIFEAIALFDGQQCEVHLRVAEHGGRLYLDLCDDGWRAVEIDAEGWRIATRPAPKFRRSRGSQPLPEPTRGGSLEELRSFFNLDSEGWTLVRAFLVSALRPALPFPILVARGEQGAGKSTACRVITALIDPRTSALRGAPREVRDLVAAARNSWLVCFDNLSRLPEELADAACRLATGGGFGGRELYSDHDEAVFDATRPLMLNAIPDLGATRPDFLDRAIIIDFNDIRPQARRDERQLWREFEAARPRILGALLDAVVAGLSKLPTLAPGPLPRMADFASWAAACEEGLKIEHGEFLRVYEANRAVTRNLALESSPLYEPLRELARDGFRGSTAELLLRLNAMVGDGTRRWPRWPKAPNALANLLRRIASNLRAAGIELDSSRADRMGRRIISVSAASNLPERSSVIVSKRSED
ncbi:MAG TPA: hypothetical protein VNE82_16835 [Candidatus Binataceae bacterium]|nr:hypothetical protein [Candidatus Binataceae bacterium]